MTPSTRSSESMAKKNLLIKTFLVCILCLILFFLSRFIDLKYDLSHQKKHSLSPYTKQLIKNTPSPITIHFYISTKNPPRLSLIKQEIIQFLDEIKDYGNNINVSIFSTPITDENEIKLSKIGIPKFQFSIIEKDRKQIADAFCGIVLYYADKKEVLPLVKGINSLHYDITLAISQLLQDERPFLSIISSETDSKDSPFSYLFTFLKERYDLNFIQENETIPTQSSCVLVLSPGIVTPQTSDSLYTYLENNGNAIFFPDRYSVDGATITDKESNIDSLLSSLNITLKPGLVADELCETVSFESKDTAFGVNQKYNLKYPLWPSIFSNQFTKGDYPFFSDVHQLVLSWISPVSSTNDGAITLIESSPKSWLLSSISQMSPKKLFDFRQNQQRYPLAILYDNPNDSLGKYAVFGSSYFIRDTISTRFPTNLYFTLNFIDWMSLSHHSHNIPRLITNQYLLRKYTDGEKTILKSLVFLISPLLLFLGGLFYLGLNRKQK
ncbi:hypothetical protein DID78_04310 [Candidatus Marinamargulisbacteria bacterium SCGC AG-343-D04]|nr:hypothetical protein DID78_04310 [Candidatus Marinamargulisbacteria bacterium SCGC AG-343-D04]